MGMFDFFKPPLKKRWIYIEIGISADKDIVGVLKRKLQPYAEDLGWEIIIEMDEEDQNRSPLF